MMFLSYLRFKLVALICYKLQTVTCICSSWTGDVSIADVAVRKRHQRHEEILITFTSTILESAKLFFCRQRVCISNKRMLCETRVFIANVQACAVRSGLR